MSSASAEGDDAADRIVRRDADGHTVPGYHLDPEAAHPAAQLCQHLVTLVALDAIKTSTVDRHDRALHINQIVLAQMLSSLQSKIVPHLAPGSKPLQRPDGGFDAGRERGVVVAGQQHRSAEGAAGGSRCRKSCMAGQYVLQAVEAHRDDRHPETRRNHPDAGQEAGDLAALGPTPFGEYQY